MAGTKREALNPLASAQRRMAESTSSLLQTQLNQVGLQSSLEDDGTLTVGNYKLTGVGLIDNGASETEWRSLGSYFRSVQKAWVWLVADWMRTGERKYGKTYEDASLLVGKSVKTLYNWTSVANKVELSRRRESLDFTHHAVVAALEPDWQDYWLGCANSNKWSSRQLEAMIQQYPDGLPDGDLPAPVTGTPDLLPSGELPLLSKKERRVFNKAVRMARIMSLSDLKRMDSKQQKEMLEAARQFERLAAEIKRAVKG